ncbi:MAG: HlyD family efflux transporter periplasmic adaptor subunit [Steroidobacteraceae bacterium]
MRPALLSLVRRPEGPQVDVSAMDRRVESHWLTPRRLLALVSALLVVAAAAFGYVRFGITRTFAVASERVVISTVQRGAFHDYIPVTGNVEPRETVYLDATNGGQVAEVLVEEGAMVEAGQPLVRLNNTNLQLQVINSEAVLSENLNRLASTKLLFEQTRLAHAKELIDIDFQIEQARQRLARLKSLANTGAIRRADIEDAELDLKRLMQLKGALEHAAAVDNSLQLEQIRQLDKTVDGLNRNFELARQNLDNLVIKASLAGQLTSLEAHLGESKAPGQRLGQIDQVDGFKVVAFVDEHYLSRVTAGQHATADVGGERRQMQVAKVYPEVRERQFKIDLAFTGETPPSVRRGQTLQLRLEIGAAREGPVVANGPFYDDTGGQWAFVLVGTGSHAERRPMKLGRRNPEKVEVLEGLEPGDRVITSGYERLKDFERIELK